MVSYFGLSDKIGNKSYFDSSGQSEYSFTKPYSEKTAELIDDEVSVLIDSQYERAKKLLHENMEGLKKLAEHLLEKEVIFTEDLEKIFGKRKFNPDELPMVEKAMQNDKEAQSRSATVKKPGIPKKKGSSGKTQEETA